ncbi:hypothetical protein QTI51_37855 [Variovorax sp. J22G73]|uniref:hypothetical protein n=1 Tax=unclassified Variovorax TaxID=663243 RepID=UPI002574ED15|nr:MULTISPECIES: hypothetical protein [unclassified Variovorax]MDM0010581.1 hypothetical protein [Variovorax sp. J22R203]MDM0103090.1 hypothetical protein [Variovorax sp. J22G73]
MSKNLGHTKARALKTLHFLIFAMALALAFYLVVEIVRTPRLGNVDLLAATEVVKTPSDVLNSPFKNTTVLGKAPPPYLSEPSKPSFDCKLPASAVKEKICADPLLGRLDSQLESIFRAQLQATNVRTLKSQHARWKEEVRDTCADIECLKRVYELEIYKRTGSFDIEAP